MTKGVDKGQVALVLVLIMTVVSALAVSLASWSTVDTRIQQAESQSVQALISAQTGLEQLIANPAPSIVAPDSSYVAQTSNTGSESFDAGRVETGSTLELSLAGADPHLTGFSVYWGPDNANPSSTPAIFISLVDSNGKITDTVYGYTSINGFIQAGDGSGGYAKSTGVISLSNIEKIRITILEAPALVKVLPIGAFFPAQITTIKSVGSVDTGSNTVKYGLQYDESTNDTVPGIFDYALFSGGSIVQ